AGKLRIHTVSFIVFFRIYLCIIQCVQKLVKHFLQRNQKNGVFMKTVYKSTEISRENKEKTRKKRDFCIQCVNLHVKTVKKFDFPRKTMYNW
ncbi:MAG: hypothetical protein EGR31_11465, partial [Clostridium sp.]|nr:hypothetical protein [Clostridium sp.]